MEARLRREEAEAKDADFQGAREAEALRAMPNADGWSRRESGSTRGLNGGREDDRVRKSMANMAEGPAGGGGPSWNNDMGGGG
eukprot:CAMPEP_0119541740 /NCGR_PEP_ID=MMETSP1344-20130328/53146_1 /TAXON_ID=236787 /ORGANISM="Florenciella parvula, Strain CCMP2471" /LENGTH=82 /DNA_ID=CAMNT_0007585789 /DNA_START=268 /DNA_END=512 /DNA_ORIENTATION=-